MDRVPSNLSRDSVLLVSTTQIKIAIRCTHGLLLNPVLKTSVSKEASTTTTYKIWGDPFYSPYASGMLVLFLLSDQKNK